VTDIETLIVSFGYSAIFLLMITNGVVSLPSSQFIYVTAGFFIPMGKLELLPVVFVGALGNTVGNIVLYEVSRRKGLMFITRWQMFRDEKIKKLQFAFKQRGSVIIFIGKFLPGVKVVVPVVAGIASMNRIWYATIIMLTSVLWALGLTYFGMYFGRNSGNGRFVWYSSALVLLAIVAIYIFHKYIQRISVEKVNPV
jgi:membrane protein DedA with SNARE-associated domain